METLLQNLNSTETKDLKVIKNLVGKALPVITRLKVKGIYPNRFRISHGSESITEKLGNSKKKHFGKIEIHKKGVIVSFSGEKGQFIWVLPYKNFELKMSGQYYEIRSSSDFIAFENRARNGATEPVLENIVKYQNDYLLKDSIKSH